MKIFNFEFFWLYWFLMIKFDSFECFDDSLFLNSNVDQKIKVWLLCDCWLFINWFNFQLSITCIFGNVLRHVIRSRCCIWVLEIMLQAIRSCTRSNVNDQSSSIKTLIWQFSDRLSLRNHGQPLIKWWISPQNIYVDKKYWILIACLPQLTFYSI